MATCLVTECEVEVDVPTYSGYTPLHVAAGGNRKELVAYLIAMGADPYMQTDEEEMPEDLTKDSEVSGVIWWGTWLMHVHVCSVCKVIEAMDWLHMPLLCPR